MTGMVGAVVRACARQRRCVKAGEGSWVTMLLVLMDLGTGTRQRQWAYGGDGIKTFCKWW